MARSCHCLTNFVPIVVQAMFSAPIIRRSPLAQEHFAHPLRGCDPVPGGMAKAFYVSFWCQVTTAIDEYPFGGPKRWVWLHSCWCRRLNSWAACGVEWKRGTAASGGCRLPSNGGTAACTAVWDTR